MKFTETPLKGAYVIDLEKREDERGFFARAFCVDELASHGLDSRVVQINNSLNRRKGTLRGMHYQLAPHRENKIVRCIRGSLYDVFVDLRPDSPTFLQAFGVQLTAENRRVAYVPEGFAHGFLTLEDDAELLYLVSARYAPESERGLKWNDPRLGIEWPAEPLFVSEKDQRWPDFDPEYHLGS